MGWGILIGLVVIVTAIVIFKKMTRGGGSADTHPSFSPSSAETRPSFSTDHRSDRRELMPDTEQHRRYPIAVVGESHSNPDGTPRQSIIESCRAGDAVRLVPEPTNRHDPNAVKVIHPAGQVGYVSGDSAPRIRDDIDAGRIVGAEILGIQGPAGRRGVSLQITAIKGRIKKRGDIAG